MKAIRGIVIAITLIFTSAVYVSAQDYQRLFGDFRSAGLTSSEKRFLQTALAFNGHYNGLLDGDWGPLSQRALNSYAQSEFGTYAEEWHMAALAFDFFELADRDGWGIRYFDILGYSFLFPFRSVEFEENSELFVNWRHVGSSLSYSTGVHDRLTVGRLHEFTVGQHSSRRELYTLRRDGLAITSAIKPDGGVLYTRSDYFGGRWATVMLSADRQDVNMLNAVAASVRVGRAPDITITPGGNLERAIKTTLAMLSEPQPSERSEGASNGSGPSGSSSSGTGFVVSADGHVLTNAHVVEGCRQIEFEAVPAKVLAVSQDFDLALLIAKDFDVAAVARFAASPAKLNSDVTVIGYPLAGLLDGVNVTRGAVSSQRGFDNDVAGMQITAPVQPGNSGGPVVGADGDVVGVVVSKLNAKAVADMTGDIPQNINFAVRGEIAKLFLFQNGVEPTVSLSDEPIPPTEIAEQAVSFTGHIQCN